MNQLDQFAQEILDLIKNEKGRPIPPGIVVRNLSDKNGIRHDSKDGKIYKTKIYQAIDDLIAKGLVRQLSKNNKLVIGYEDAPALMDDVKEGTISIGARNCGFIRLPNQDRAAYFVYSLNLNGALNGDTVKFALLDKPATRDLKDATVLEVVTRHKSKYVGKYTFNGSQHVVYPDDPKLYLTVTLDKDYGLKDNDKILFEIAETKPNGQATARLVHVIGNANDLGVDIESIVYDNGITPQFDPKALAQAHELKLDLNEKQMNLRRDLTNLDIVTIDPATSKDLDDAIYVERLEKGFKLQPKDASSEGVSLPEGGFKLIVAIADVSHYIPFNSDLDNDAFNRATSVYLVNKVIPMLPEVLSNDLCSINPGVKRMALVSEIIYDHQGKVVETTAYPAVIESKRRYSYDEVNAFFSGVSQLENDPQGVKSMLGVARELATTLKSVLNKRGYVEFEIPEPVIVLDENNIPTDISISKHEEAQAMVEVFMIAANEAVTQFATQQNVPFLFRVHPKPTPRKLAIFSKEAKRLDFKITDSIAKIHSGTIAHWLESNPNNPNLEIIHRLLLRAMAKAFYNTTNIHHFGLASKHYTHFTSPIRRYPDLIVHRLLWMYLFDKESYSDEQRKMLADKLNAICEQSNLGETRAMECERSVNAYMFCLYMGKHIGDKFEGIISSVMNYGMFVELPNTVDGLVRVINMNDDFYTYDEPSSTLVGKSHGKRYALGDKVKIEVASTNLHDRKIDFVLAKE
ncbi:ribonuclease R [[Mycoplasma] testudinis]|uniref:ribonuclease R n=1 Tax=[Mycoplasma] testudinis TaxID=33924 RepID=UPI0004842B44|nr:ribonuclease R [[Mycoplasma] testudinis]